MGSKVDIESAIAGIFEPDNINDKNIQFYVDGNKSWVEFRAGHSGDAASLTTLFSRRRNSARKIDGECEETSGDHAQEVEALEMIIEDSIGDEHSTPAVHVIIAEICTETDQSEFEEESNCEKLISKEICGAVFATIDWNPNQSMRYLSVEEIAIDESKIQVKDLLLRRFLLSLSAIALKTSCGGVLIASSARTVLDNRVAGARSEEEEDREDC